MKIKRTLFSCLMALALVCVCLLVLPTEAQAASVDDLDFSFNELHQEYAVSLCDSDASGNLEIPATYNGYPVTSIEGSAFSHCAGLTSVTIPDGITYISSFAFYDCPGLISVHIGDGIHTLTMAVFDGCSNLSSVTIGSGVKVIGQYAFHNCPNLTEVYYNGTEEQWNAISVLDENDILSEATICFLADFTYSVTEDNATITGYTGTGGEVIIPSKLGGYPVTTIGDQAFYECTSLTEIVIPDSVTIVRPYAFAGCDNLSEITISDSVDSIWEGAFGNCPIKKIVVREGSKTITSTIIVGRSTLEEVIIPDSVTTIDDRAFEYCTNLTKVVIPNSVATIGFSAFSCCDSLTEIAIPDSVTLIGNFAFFSCNNLTGIWVDSENTIYSSDTSGVLFNKDKTTLIAAPATIVSYTIPDSVITIGFYAFDNCNNLTEIAIPDSVTTINHAAFCSCSRLTNVYYAGSESQWNIIAVDVDNYGLLNATIHYQHIHDYTMFPPVYSDATCTQPEYTEYRCIYGETYRKETSPELGHDFSGKVTVTPPTCDAQGYTETKCIRCSETTKADYTDSLGHKMVYAPATAPTCGTAGCTEGTVCERCGEMGVGTILPATGNHSYSNTWDTTCNTCGGKRTVSLSNTAPTSFKATLTGYNDVKLTWKAGKGANRYYVYYRRAGKTEWKRAGITTGLTYTIKDLVENGKYEFKVISYLKDSSGTYKGASTKVLTCSTTRNLKAPSKVTVKLYGYDDVKLSWSKVTYANGYKVYYKRSTAKSYSYVGFTTGTSIKKANLSDGVKYTFKVVPCTKVNGSYFADDSSKTASITTLKTVSTPKVTKYTSSKVKVSWTDISGESGYQVVVTSDKAGKKKVTTTTTTGKSKVVTAKKGKTYYYKVRAYKTVDGKKIYAPWSKVKAYKLK